MKPLAENKFGVSYAHSPSFHIWNRFWRRKVADAGTPFNWSVGISGRPMYNIKNQQQSDSCFGQAGSRAIQILLNSPELSAKSLYSQCFAPGGGVWYPDGESVLLNKGLTTEANVPSTAPDGTCTEQFMEDTTWLTPAMAKDCLTRSGYEFLTVNIDPDSIANAIQQYEAVIFIVQGQNGNGWLGETPTPPSQSNTDPIWEHFLCFTSNIPSQTSNYYIPFYNSWGLECGINGIQNLSSEYINSGYVVDVFAIVPFKFETGLGLGSMGTQVNMLQEILRKTGDFTFPINTGFFGPLTYLAVTSYQKRNGLQGDGIIGPKTITSLNAYLTSLQQG